MVSAYLDDEAGEVDALVEFPPLEFVLFEPWVAPTEVPVAELYTGISLHSGNNGNPYRVQSCRRSNRIWCNKWFSKPFVSDNDVKALAMLASSDSENQTGGVFGYVSCKSKVWIQIEY